MSALLESAAAEVEAHVGRSGWDRPPALFALIRASQFVLDEPDAAARLGLADARGDALTPIEQEELPDGELDEVLAQLGWPESVAGCALVQEIVILPPSAQAELTDDETALSAATQHPERREARLVVAVLRTGESAAVLRLRAVDGGSEDDLLTGSDLAPNLTHALLETLSAD